MLKFDCSEIPTRMYTGPLCAIKPHVKCVFVLIASSKKVLTVLFDGTNLTVLWKGFRYLLKNGNVMIFFLPSWIINHRERIRIAILISIKTRHPYIWEHKRKQLIYIYILFFFLSSFSKRVAQFISFPQLWGPRVVRCTPHFPYQQRDYMHDWSTWQTGRK